MASYQAHFSPQATGLEAGVSVFEVDDTGYTTPVDSRELDAAVTSPTDPAVSRALADMGYPGKNTDILGVWQLLDSSEYVLDLD